jgi:hypothetical protein
MDLELRSESSLPRGERIGGAIFRARVMLDGDDRLDRRRIQQRGVISQRHVTMSLWDHTEPLQAHIGTFINGSSRARSASHHW